MSGFGGCYPCSPNTHYPCGPPYSTCKGSLLLPVLLILIALFFCSAFGWILIILGIALLFGNKLLNCIF